MSINILNFLALRKYDLRSAFLGVFKLIFGFIVVIMVMAKALF